MGFCENSRAKNKYIQLFTGIFIILVVLSLIVMWICILSPDLYYTKVVHRLIFPFKEKSLDPKDLALYKDIETAGNIPWSYSKLNITKRNLSDQDGSLGIIYNCSKRPDLVDIQIHNNYWQMARMESTDVYAYGAFLDTRVMGQPVIRILVNSHDHLKVSRSVEMQKSKFCQIWYPGLQNPAISEVSSMDYIWKKSDNAGNNHPFLITCKLPKIKIQSYRKLSLELKRKTNLKLKVFPESVSLVEEKCEKASNNLRINYKVPEKKADFGVCVRWLDFPTQDLSLRLIEWIEMMTILGAGGIHFHFLAVHPNVLKVLKYYEKSGRVTIKSYSLPGNQPNLPQLRHNYLYHQPIRGTKMWRQEVIPLNDCFYTNMYSYKYIAAIDIDEVILPRASQNWKDLIAELNVSSLETPCFKMEMFTETIIKSSKKNLSILSLPPEKRNANHVKDYPYMMTQLNTPILCNTTLWKKCLFSTKNVLLVHNHWPMACLTKPCHFTVDSSLAYIHHHRKFCDLKWFNYYSNKSIQVNQFRYDDTILKYKDELIQRRNYAVSSMIY